ncbi:MAG: zinc-binding dehydrogenase [Roseiflexaceae bacterium]|nr:zinc-binding dehydrogenase [Roseiflexaceae bacterium]
MPHIPATMQALVLTKFDGAGALELRELPTPQPEPGQLLVKMVAAPINPSDLMFLDGLYGVRPELPHTAGFEGSGVVVASGGGLYGGALVGRRVATSALEGGTWAEYCLAPTMGCIPLTPQVSTLSGAMALVNPFTAWALVAIARRQGAKAAVQTAAASALGRMIIRLSQRFDLPVINIVRRQEQVEQLRALGATHILNSADADFDQQLKQRCRELGATVAFDAVAGELTGQLLQAMPRHSEVHVYGALSLGAISAHPGDLIFRDQRILGFYLGHWLREQNPAALLRTAIAVQRLLAKEFRSEVRAVLPLAQHQRALKLYSGDMTGGKVLFVP